MAKRKKILQRQGQVKSEGDLEPAIQNPKRRETFRTALKEVNKRYSPALKKLAE